MRIMLDTKNLQAQMRVAIRLLRNPLITKNYDALKYLLAILEDLSFKISELEIDLKKLELIEEGNDV